MQAMDTPHRAFPAPAAAPEDATSSRLAAEMPTPEPWRGIPPHRLRRVLASIETRLMERIKVAELAAEANMSPFHFSRMFKRATGHSPHQYVTLQRMARAKELLATTTTSIAEVARLAGYTTQAHFTGVFARHVGVTPHAYRMGQRPAAGTVVPNLLGPAKST